MKPIKYFLQFIFTIIFFTIFKILGPKLSSNLGGILFERIGPLFRPKKLIHSNIKKAIPEINDKNLGLITSSMWNNYGRVFGEYIFISEFRNGKLSSSIEIEGKEILDEIKKKINK